MDEGNVDEGAVEYAEDGTPAVGPDVVLGTPPPVRPDRSGTSGVTGSTGKSGEGTAKPLANCAVLAGALVGGGPLGGLSGGPLTPGGPSGDTCVDS